MEVESQLAMNYVNKKIKLCFFGGGRNVKLHETYKGKAEKMKQQKKTISELPLTSVLVLP